jgi:hypothetical protein
MSNKQIITSSGIELQNNQPLDVRDRIQTLSEVNTILNPDIGGIFYCLDTGYYYTITSLTDDLSGVKDYELFTSVGAESVTINDEIIKVTDSNVITIPDDSRYIYESKELRNSQKINITKEKEGKLYNNFYTAENDLRDFLGKTLSSDLKNSIKMVCTAFGKTNQDSDRDIISDISGNGNNLVLSGFSYTPNSGYGNPDYPCALVTDGIDDFIYSDKTLDSIIGNSGKVTVISMITQISDIEGESFSNSINNIRYNSSLMCTRNIVAKGNTGKTGIYGYTCPNLKVSPTVPNSVKLLGDKEDYVSQGGTHQTNDIYSVVGYKNSSNGNLAELSQVAWYWTIIADRVLTENEIHLIIEYYNLDRCITPQVYYNISQQGITNDNHSDFSDKLVDLSGHGYDMQLNNIAWEKQSGIGNYPISFKDYTYLPDRGNVIVNKDNFIITSNTSTANLLEVNTKNKVLPTYKVKIEGVSTITEGNLKWRINTTASVTTYVDILEDGIYDIPATPQTEEAAYSGWCISKYNESVNVKVTVLPIDDIENTLCLNGVDDFGKTTGLPVLKDYTVVADRKFLNFMIDSGGIVSKAATGDQGAFILEQSQSPTDGIIQTWTFGKNNTNISNSKITERGIVVQTKYQYNYSANLTLGSGIDQSSMWMGTLRDNDTRFSKVAIWSFLLYPYSMSEFLIERQLKKLKLGTLYPGMIQWKPIVESNIPYKRILYFNVSTGNPILVGDYIPIGTRVQINIATTNETDEISKVTLNGEEMTKGNVDAQYWRFILAVTRSPQRIDITIDEYIRYEDILQPYPTVIHFKNEDGTHEYTYGDKIKIGSRIKYLNFENLLSNFYTIVGALYFNGNRFGSDESIKYAVVEKNNTLNWSVKCKWKLSTPEALFMYDPDIINNTGLSNLGYLPDLTGQGRHLKLNNFTYEGISGKDGYPVVFGANKTWLTIRPNNSESFMAEYHSNYISITKISFNIALLHSYIKSEGVLTEYNKEIPSFKVKVRGLSGDFGIRYAYIDSETSTTKQTIQISEDGTYTLPKSYAGTDNLTDENIWVGFSAVDLKNIGHYDCNITIEVQPEYTGALCFDGVDDRGTVENIAYGGKYLGMKTNWQRKGTVLYDQRKTVSYTGLCVYIPSDSEVSKFPAYQTRNQDGYTYIDSVLNKYITTAELYAKTHVFETICETDNSSNTVSPVFGSTVGGSNFSQFAMYRTVVLPEVPSNSDREILCEWLGTSEGYVEKPEYYWDVYGKTNDEGDSRVNILEQVRKQSGVSQDNMYLRCVNFSYEGMSGYKGYPVVLGANKTWINLRTNDGNAWSYGLTSNSITIYKVEHPTFALFYSYVNDVNGSYSITIPSFNIKVNGLKTGESIRYYYVSADNTSNNSFITINSNGIHELPASVPIQVKEETPATVWIGMNITLINNESTEGVRIEIQPEYPSGLVLDGIDDYINCNYIPEFTDYTYIIKYKDIGDPAIYSAIQHKGSLKTGGGAFIQSYITSSTVIQQYNFGQANTLSCTDEIQYCTKTNYNGSNLIVGTNTDTKGIAFGEWNNVYRKMVFYKEMLWSKTIDPLSIGMIRNLMEQDGIIDLGNKLFKKNVVISSVDNETSISNNTLIKND